MKVRFCYNEFSLVRQTSFQLIKLKKSTSVGNSKIAKAFVKFNEKIQEIEDLSIEEIFNELDEQEHFDCGSWYYFDEYFFDNFGISAYDAARAIHFGEVNWLDNYIRFNAYGNFETTNEIDYDDEKEEIVQQWIEENFEVNYGN